MQFRAATYAAALFFAQSLLMDPKSLWPSVGFAGIVGVSLLVASALRVVSAHLKALAASAASALLLVLIFATPFRDAAWILLVPLTVGFVGGVISGPRADVPGAFKFLLQRAGTYSIAMGMLTAIVARILGVDEGTATAITTGTVPWIILIFGAIAFVSAACFRAAVWLGVITGPRIPLLPNDGRLRSYGDPH